MNVCPETIRRASEGSDREFYFLVDTLAHEHLHIIGFNSDLYESFVGDDGEPLGEQAVLEPSQVSLLLLLDLLLDSDLALLRSLDSWPCGRPGLWRLLERTSIAKSSPASR